MDDSCTFCNQKESEGNPHKFCPLLRQHAGLILDEVTSLEKEMVKMQEQLWKETREKESLKSDLDKFKEENQDLHKQLKLLKDQEKEVVLKMDEFLNKFKSHLADYVGQQSANLKSIKLMLSYLNVGENTHSGIRTYVEMCNLLSKITQHDKRTIDNSISEEDTLVKKRRKNDEEDAPSIDSEDTSNDIQLSANSQKEKNRFGACTISNTNRGGGGGRLGGGGGGGTGGQRNFSRNRLGSGRGGRQLRGGGGSQRKVPTAEELDAELDAYINKME